MRTCVALAAFLLAALPGGISGAEEQRENEASRARRLDPPAGSEEDAEKPSGKGRAEAVRGRSPADGSGEPTKTRPPDRVVLPPAGIYLAPKLLRLAGKLHGLPVRVASKSINRISIRIKPSLARREVTIAELSLMLAAHSIHLHFFEHPRTGKILVAALEKDWSLPSPRYTRVFRIREGDFWRIAELVKRTVEVRNRRLPRGLHPLVAVPSARTGKIFVRAPSRKLLEEIGDFIRRHDQKDPDRPHLYSYRLKSTLRAEKARDQLLEKLSEGETQRARLVVGPWGNRILFRAEPELAKKIQGILAELDEGNEPPPTPSAKD